MNIGTFATIFIVLIVIFIIIRKLRKDKEKGKCATCPFRVIKFESENKDENRDNKT